jgi:hypothetical protein
VSEETAMRSPTDNLFVLLSCVAMATACGTPEPPPAGFGAECQFNADCDEGYVCLDATCVPDDVEAPDPVNGDGDPPPNGVGVGPNAPWTAHHVRYEATYCEDAVALYPDATFCEVYGWLGPSVPPGAETYALDPADVAGCGIIAGELHVAGLTTEHLDELSSVKAVCGDLEIAGASVTDLAGLSNLTHVIGELRLVDLADLRSLHGLEQLREAHQLELEVLPVADLEGLSGLTRAGSLKAFSLPALASLQGLSSLEELGSLWLFDLPSLTSLQGLDALLMLHFQLNISDCAELTTLEALDGVRSRVGNLELQRLPSLVRTPALELANVYVTLRSTIYLSVIDVPQLSTWAIPPLPNAISSVWVERTGLGSLPLFAPEAAVGRLTIAENPALTDLDTVASLSGVGEVVVTDNAQLDNCDVEALFSGMGTAELTVADNGGQAGCSN